jgi:hypothetical protein
MTLVSGKWQITVPVSAAATQLDVVFNNGSGTWDNNSGADWHFSVQGGQSGATWTIDGTRDSDSTLIATSGESLINMFKAWLEKYQPETNDCFDVRVRALIDGREPNDEAGWKRPKWRRATYTIRFSELDDELSQLRRLDPTAVAWAAGDDYAIDYLE